MDKRKIIFIAVAIIIILTLATFAYLFFNGKEEDGEVLQPEEKEKNTEEILEDLTAPGKKEPLSAEEQKIINEAIKNLTAPK